MNASILHDIWCQESGVRLPLSFDRDYRWLEWAKYVSSAIANSDWSDVTPESVLITVLRRRKRVAKDKPKIAHAWISWHKVVLNPDQCVEDWCEEQYENRPKPQYCKGKRDVLRATDRPDEPEPCEPVVAGEVAQRFLDQLIKATRL